MNRSFLFKAASAVATLSFAATAGAQTFANTLQTVGQAQISSGGAGSGQPLFIDFLSGVPFPVTPGNGAPGNVVTGAATGVFTSVAPFTNGTIQDLEVGGGGSPTTTNPGGNEATFMTIGGYTFTLGSAPNGSTFGPISLTDRAGGAIASFAVFGTVTGPGFTGPTTYEGSFSTQFVGETAAQVFNQINNGGTPIVTFSANFGAPVSTVPEPSTYALLATGIGALGLAARRRRANA
ncbi:hypothetical protein tb265_44420 [Gemmatimonadetes bacterium T265]|nr:hypothetical protein tb265_44420 [Gemmatimonadetes bacterium T265]